MNKNYKIPKRITAIGLVHLVLRLEKKVDFLIAVFGLEKAFQELEAEKIIQVEVPRKKCLFVSSKARRGTKPHQDIV